MKRVLSPAQRTRSQVVLGVLTGTAAAATVAGVSVATGVVAKSTEHDNAVKALKKYEAQVAYAKAHPVVVTVTRGTKRIVGPAKVVTVVGAGGATVGSVAGSSSSAGSSSGSSSSSSGSSSSGGAPAAPPPAPSTGS